MLILRGADCRIRLWWRLFGYIILLLVVLIGSEAVARIFTGSQMGSLRTALSSSLISSGGVLGLTYLYRRRVDRRKWDGMALPSPHRRLLQLAAGLALGGGMIALVFAVQYTIGGIRITGYGITGGVSASALLLAPLLRNLAVGFTEELAMRGYIFQNLMERYPVWLAVVWNGVIFGALHFAKVDSLTQWVLLILSATVVSTFLALSRLVTGSLWLAIGWHTAWNFVQGPILGLGDGPALIHLQRTASPAIVGTALMPELGIATIVVEALGLLLLLAPGIHRILVPHGQQVGHDQH